MAKYFQTDDRDDYFESLSKTKKPKKTVLYTILLNNDIILNKVKGYKCITFTKTLINVSRKSLSNNIWIKKLESLGYLIKSEKH